MVPRHYLALTVAVIAISWASILILLSGAQPIAVAFWRTALASLVLLPLALMERDRGGHGVDGRDLMLMTISGAALATHFMTWIQSLYLTTVASSVTLVSTYPVFTLVMGRLIGERPRVRATVGTLTAFLGIVIISAPAFYISTKALLGDLLALAGALSGAVYFLIGRAVRIRVSLAMYTVPVYGVAAIITLITGLILNVRFWPYPPMTWAYIAALVAGPMLLGHTLLNYSLKYSRAITVTTSTLGEPVGSTLLAWLILHQVPTPLTLLGMAVTLTGIYLVVSEEGSAAG
ncbi:DMT family transporter [Vulcanisaeta thermophila]|uniref:DMT family transporter n=1 Tax=Vulcanisaeta thermophila TaxID=867917 RepID=UPI000853A28C|nr:DMT family transporter [Vulcanisaeta thermophila]